jgi:hypothetical protein
MLPRDDEGPDAGARGRRAAALLASRTGASSDALWLSMYRPPMTDNAIYIRIVARTR